MSESVQVAVKREDAACHPVDVAEAMLLASEEGATEPTTAFGIVRRGLAAAPEFWHGMALTVTLALLGGAGRVVIPVLVQQVLDRGLADGSVNLRVVLELALGGAVVVMLTAVVTRTAQKRLAAASEAALCGLRVTAFAHIHRLSIAHHSNEHRGKLVSRVTSDVQALSLFLQWGGIAMVVNGAIMAASLVAMFVYDWRLALVVVFLVTPLATWMSRLQRRLGVAHLRVRSRVSELLTVVSETAQGAAVVRAYGIEDRTNGRVLRAIGRWRDAKIHVGGISSLLFSLGELFSAIALTGVLVAGLALGPISGLSIGTLVAFVVLVNVFLDPVTEFTEVVDHMQGAVAGWRKVLDLLEIPVEVVDPVPGMPMPDTPPALSVERVTYSYRAGATPALEDVSFAVEAGSRVALVGATGSGKTTVAKLIARLADPTRGRILVNGIDLREIAPDSLRSRLGMVPQDGLLFDTSVAANVALGRPEATQDEIRTAFADLGLDTWLDGLPQGLETPVGERGENLSMGERQFVALARAYVAAPMCLILDEATSSVDPATDARLTHAMRRLAAGRTTITIAHRLATAEHADEILVLDHGRLVERGSHARLVVADGVYARLHASWLDVTATGSTAAAV